MKINWPVKKLGDVIELKYGKGISKFDRRSDGKYPIYGANGELSHSDKYLIDDEAIIIGRKGSAGEVTRVSGKFWPSDVTYYVLGTKQIDIDFLFYLLKKIDLTKLAVGVKPGINRNRVYEIEIPLPPLKTQKKIVSKIEKLFAKIDEAQKLREEAKKETKSLLQSTLNEIFSGPKSKGWKKKKLFEIVKIIGGGTPAKNNLSYYKGNILWATVRDLKNDFITDTEFKISEEAVKQSSTNIIPANNIILVTRVGLGKMSITTKNTAINQDLKALIPREKVQLDKKYLFLWLKTQMEFIKSQGRGATVMGVRLELINNLIVPFPPIAEQKKIVARLDGLTEKIREMEKLQAETATDLENLKQSILNQAFNGEEN